MAGQTFPFKMLRIFAVDQNAKKKITDRFQGVTAEQVSMSNTSPALTQTLAMTGEFSFGTDY